MRRKGGIELKLTRSRDDVIVSGVLAGLGEYFGIDPTWVRIVVAVLILFTPFPVIPLYLIGAIIIPKAPKKRDKDEEMNERKERRRDRQTRTNKDENQSSSTVEDIDEEDWSDF